ncbi:MAG: GxxExxY protein [candidate division Zixibacteria bacterium]|nr:GxxExxY protein [candidate division Zixibacteria bacterium]
MTENELAEMTDQDVKDLQNQVTEAALEIQKNIGLGFSTTDYCRAFAYELKLRKIPYETDKKVELSYKGEIAGRYQLDFLVNKQMIITVLSAEEIASSDQSKQRNFLKALNLKIGMVINFANEKVEIKAVYR